MIADNRISDRISSSTWHGDGKNPGESRCCGGRRDGGGWRGGGGGRDGGGWCVGLVNEPPKRKETTLKNAKEED